MLFVYPTIQSFYCHFGILTNACAEVGRVREQLRRVYISLVPFRLTPVVSDCVGDCTADRVELHCHLIARCECDFRAFGVVFLLRVREIASTACHKIAAVANTIACI
jgi:hypothetical protein